MNYLLVGCGAMGRAVEQAAEQRGHRCTLRVDRSDPWPADRSADLDMAFEFTVGSAAETNLIRIVESGLPAVCGTTGWSPTPRLREAVRQAGVGVVLAPNFSVGVNLFFRVVEHASELFGRTGLHEPFIVEHHHRAKRDAPSGTARELSRRVLAADRRFRRVVTDAGDGRLPEDALHVASVRAGGEPGRHLVGFDAEVDTITLEHRSRSRAGFAQGAVMAAEWVLQRPGLHDFDAVLDDWMLHGLPADAAAGREGESK